MVEIQIVLNINFFYVVSYRRVNVISIGICISSARRKQYQARIPIRSIGKLSHKSTLNQCSYLFYRNVGKERGNDVIDGKWSEELRKGSKTVFL